MKRYPLEGSPSGQGEAAVPIHTFAATWLAILSVGVTPLGIDKDTHIQIDLDILDQITCNDCIAVAHVDGS
jgi:hypothetical protein